MNSGFLTVDLVARENKYNITIDRGMNRIDGPCESVVGVDGHALALRLG